MNEHLNPVYPNTRGCFIDRYSVKGKILVVDYPTWTLDNGKYVSNANARIPAGQPYSKEFDTLDEARAFADSENYVICTMPRELDPNRKNKAPIIYEIDKDKDRDIDND